MEKESDHFASANGTPDPEQNDVDAMDAMDEQSAAKEKLTANDPNKIKFTSVNLVDGKNGEAKVDIHVVQTSIGMGKEELMKYANEPFWIRLRLFLFILFWLAWIAMLVGAVVIILVAPRCPPAPRLNWYQKASMYQIDIGTFKDSNGDGTGDLKGLLSKLDYFSKINVKALLLNAVYAMAPETNSPLNYTSIDSKFGTMSDMDELLAEAKKRDLKVVLDFIPNHTSDEHPWFKASVAKEDFYKDFYIWADARNGGPPNEWRSVHNHEIAWGWNEERKQYYLCTYRKNEPDLNLRNEVVQEKMKDFLRFWLEKGIDGFKVLHASYLIEDESLREESLSIGTHSPEDHLHSFRVDHPENFVILREWRELVNNYSSPNGGEKILMAEVSSDVNTTLKYYKISNTSEVLIDLPINMQLMELTKDLSPKGLKEILEFWTDKIVSDKTGWPAWMLGSNATRRLADRIGPELVDGIHMVSLLALGTPITFFGDELGMRDYSNGISLMFMPWTNRSLYVHPEHEAIFGGPIDESFQVENVEAELVDEKSHLKIFSRLVELRQQPAINFGIQDYPVVTDEVFSMLRVRKGSPGYLIVTNMSSNSTVVDFSNSNKHLPENGRVEIRSGNIDSGPLYEGDHPKIKLSEVALGPRQSVVFSFIPKFED